MFSSSSTSPPSVHFSSDPRTDLSLAHKRSRPFETSLTRQMSTDDDMIKSPTTSHDRITSDALQLTASSLPSSASSSSSLPPHQLPSPSAVLSPSAASSSFCRSVSPSTEESSRFPSRHQSFDVSSFVDSYPFKRKRHHSQMDLSSTATPAAAAAAAASAQPLFSPNKEQRIHPLSSSSSSGQSASSQSLSSSQAVYSLEQVKRIVKSALQLQEDKLREEYNAVLNELLREQFENFDRFNKDYISRQLRNTDLSYLS